MPRTSTVFRETNETKIKIDLNLDGTGRLDGTSSIPFFDHLLAQVVRHGAFDLQIDAEGDTHIDCHHLVEDFGIVLGSAIKEALGSKEKIIRYGSAFVPMDETLALCAVDLCGRAYLRFDVGFTTAKLGELDTEMIREFFRALCMNAGMNLHIKLMHGENNHHIAEAVFKAFGRAMREAASIDPRVNGIPSTKGSLQ